MKSLLKFSLLSALIISGKLVKQTAPTTVAQTTVLQSEPANKVLLVHQVIPAKGAKPAREQVPPQQSGSGLLADMF